MGARKRAAPRATAEAPCIHVGLMMLAYVGGLSPRTHTTLHWCPDCGALARKGVLDEKSFTTWAYPEGRKPTV